MGGENEKIVEDIIGALSEAIVVVIRSLEWQLQGKLDRHQIAMRLEDQAQGLPGNIDNRALVTTILRNISARLDDKPTTPIKFRP